MLRRTSQVPFQTCEDSVLACCCPPHRLSLTPDEGETQASHHHTTINRSPFTTTNNNNRHRKSKIDHGGLVVPPPPQPRKSETRPPPLNHPPKTPEKRDPSNNLPTQPIRCNNQNMHMHTHIHTLDHTWQHPTMTRPSNSNGNANMTGDQGNGGNDGPHAPQSAAPSSSPHKQSQVLEQTLASPALGRKRPRICRLVSYDNIVSPLPMQYPSCEKNVIKVPGLQTHIEDAAMVAAHVDENRKPNSKVLLPPLSASMNTQPSSADPLRDRQLLSLHLTAIRLEVELQPMRSILSKLMMHQAHNRKGIFNSPVDPAALKLPDYLRIIAQPMDLGTVKRRLHAVAYKCRSDVAADVRLTFHNAMKYNPPHNAVHNAAKQLLVIFENAYQTLDPTPSDPPIAQAVAVAVPIATVAPSTSSIPASAQSLPTATAQCMPVAATAPPTASQALPVLSALSPRARPAGRRTSFHHSELPSAPTLKRKRSCSSSLSISAHNHQQHRCDECHGRECAMCLQGCLLHEPSLVICQGQACAGARLRKGAQYHVTRDGTQQYCQRCYANLPPTLPRNPNDPVIYKQHLLKRKNDEEVAEKWITCSKCDIGMHQICAMFNPAVHSRDNFFCPPCRNISATPSVSHTNQSEDAIIPEHALYTYMSGYDAPVPMSSIVSDNSTTPGDGMPTADSLPKCAISSFIEDKVRSKVQAIPNAGATITVRIVSDCDRSFVVPDAIRRHFRMNADGAAHHGGRVVKPPKRVNYNQKAIMLFQRIDGHDVSVFSMYVQEYEGNDEYEVENEQTGQRCTTDNHTVKAPHAKRVYIAYLDSVEHFRPRKCRTTVYHEIIVAYLATAREQGFETAQIWACPPSKGSSFVFWNHPASQRTPNQDRLTAWYNSVLSRGVDCGVITDIKSLYESEFQTPLNQVKQAYAHHAAAAAADGSASGVSLHDGRMLAPPLLDGDFWLEEAVRIHTASLLRYQKSKSTHEVCVWNVTPTNFQDLDPCPAVQIASLIRERIITHPSAAAFRKPVNAAALKLKDYHKIVTKPMDLATIYSKCTIGEYYTLREVIDDVELMVANAKRFNPPGHFVHLKATEVLDIFYQELDALCMHWPTEQASSSTDQHQQGQGQGQAQVQPSRSMFTSMNMALDHIIAVHGPKQASATVMTPHATTSVVIEDDPSIDCSKSLGGSSMDTSTFSAQSIKDSNSHANTQSERELSPDAQSQLHSGTIYSTSSSQGCQHSSSVTVVSTGVLPPKQQQQPKKLDLLTGGPEAVHERMCGDDTFLMKKSSSPSSKNNPGRTSAKTSSKKSGGKKRRGSTCCATSSNTTPSASGGASVTTASTGSGMSSAANKKRRQSWLGEEVADCVRRMRLTLFTCSLGGPSKPTDANTSTTTTSPTPTTNMSAVEAKQAEYQQYAASFRTKTTTAATTTPSSTAPPTFRSKIADARHTLLEFSQYRHFEFDTLRHAKYSTKMLVYYLQNDDAPGIVPHCTSCKKTIQKVRWHRTKKHAERQRQRSSSVGSKKAAQTPVTTVPWTPEELCGSCHEIRNDNDDFIPVPVSIKP